MRESLPDLEAVIDENTENNTDSIVQFFPQEFMEGFRSNVLDPEENLLKKEADRAIRKSRTRLRLVK